MKKILLISFALLIVTCISQAQTIRVANNNPGAATGINVFVGATALQDAITASTAGDIIYVVPSAVNYGIATITQPLTLFGIGISPDSQSPNRSFLNTIVIDASDVRISGISSTSEIQLGFNTTGTLNNIIIENSRVKAVKMQASNCCSTSDISTLLIRNNVIQGTTGGGGHIRLRTTSNAVVTNNFFITNFTNGADMVVACCGAVFQYNLFADNGNDPPYDELMGCVFNNNIFYGTNPQIPASSINNIWNYNMSFGGGGTAFNTTTNGNTGTGNIENIDPLFVNMPITDTWTSSLDITLTASSPALSTDAGNGSGEDIGPSGGATPFNFEGNLLPLIQSVIVPAVIPVGADLPVTIKAKGN